MMPAGADSFGRIDLQFPQTRPSATLDTVKQIYVSRIPQVSKSDEGTLEDPSNDPNFNEPIIDRLRMQREEVMAFLICNACSTIVLMDFQLIHERLEETSVNFKRTQTKRTIFFLGDQRTAERHDGRPHAENSCARSILEGTLSHFSIRVCCIL